MSEKNLDPSKLKDNQFIGQTRSVPRPTASDRPYQWSGGAADLVRDQARWDFARDWQAGNDRLRSERLAAIEAERQAKRDQWRAEAAASVLDELRKRYLGSDPTASEQDFDADLPEIRRRLRIDAAVSEPQTRGRG